jgi:hypothetical protein
VDAVHDKQLLMALKTISDFDREGIKVNSSSQVVRETSTLSLSGNP